MLDFKRLIAEAINEALVKEPGSQMGSNEGGVHTDSETGEKHYVKHYKNADQAKTEALTGKIYKHMGIKTLDPEYHEINGKPSISTKWNPDVKTMHPSEYEKLKPEQAKQIGKMYHGAILTKNWDIVGLQHDNIVKHQKTGDLHAIDHGGAFNFRAQGGHKDYGPDIAEKKSLKDNDNASGHVFTSVLSKHPEAEKAGIDAVRKIDDEHVHGLFKNSGLSNWKELHSNFMERKKKLLDSSK